MILNQLLNEVVSETTDASTDCDKMDGLKSYKKGILAGNLHFQFFLSSGNFSGDFSVNFNIK